MAEGKACSAESSYPCLVGLGAQVPVAGCQSTTLYNFRIDSWSLKPALIASRRYTRVYRFRLEAVYCRIRSFGGVLPRDDLDAMENLPRARIEGVPDFGLVGFERVQPGLAGGAEIACSGAGEKGDKGAKFAACETLAGRGESGVQVVEGYPTC